MQYANTVHCQNSSLHSICIKPLTMNECSCQDYHQRQTLSEFSGNYSDVNITSLIFLAENHSLDSELYLSPAENLSLAIAKDEGDETVFIECTDQLGQFNISETAFVSMRAGCAFCWLQW